MQEETKKVSPEQITSIIDKIEKKLSGKDKMVVEHFYYIKSFLKQSLAGDSDEVNIAKICEAVHYIETIKIEKQRKFFFFQETTPLTMAEQMKKNGEIILPERERALLPNSLTSAGVAVPVEAEKHFRDLHKDLVELISTRYQYLKDDDTRKKNKNPSLAWNYDYPLDEQFGEVMNQTIGEWQLAKIPMNSNSTRAYSDIKRNVSIRGVTANTDKDVEDLLEYLVKGSSYSYEDQKIIKQWMQANGGQDMNRFVDLLFLKGEFTGHEDSGLLSTQSLGQGWGIEEGKVVFFYEALIYAINVNCVARVNDGTGHLRIEHEPELIKSSGTYKMLPLMKVNSNIELKLSEGKVIPSITALNVHSYSPDLLIPKTEFLNDARQSMYNK